MRNFKTGALSLTVALSSAFMICSANVNADIIIDDFSDVANPNPFPLSVSGGGPFVDGSAEIGIGGALGGVRVSDLTLVQALAPFDNANMAIYPVFGMLDFNSTSGAGANLGLTYPGLGGLNADFSTEAGINIRFVAFDLGSGDPTQVRIELFDGVNVATLTNTLTVAGAQISQFAFADFVNIGALNLSSIQSVRVTFNVDSNLGVDFRVDNITTYIPAPGALALLAMAGLAPLRRRRA